MVTNSARCSNTTDPANPSSRDRVSTRAVQRGRRCSTTKRAATRAIRVKLQRLSRGLADARASQPPRRVGWITSLNGATGLVPDDSAARALQHLRYSTPPPPPRRNAMRILPASSTLDQRSRNLKGSEKRDLVEYLKRLVAGRRGCVTRAINERIAPVLLNGGDVDLLHRTSPERRLASSPPPQARHARVGCLTGETPAVLATAALTPLPPLSTIRSSSGVLFLIVVAICNEKASLCLKTRADLRPRQE